MAHDMNQQGYDMFGIKRNKIWIIQVKTDVNCDGKLSHMTKRQKKYITKLSNCITLISKLNGGAEICYPILINYYPETKMDVIDIRFGNLLGSINLR